MSDFLRGFFIPFKGIFIVFSSFRLFLLAVLPFWICLFTFIYFVWTFWSHSFSVVPYLMEWIPGLYEFTEKLKIGEFSLFAALIQGVFWFFLLIFSSYFSYILLSIIGAPFYSFMVDIILSRRGMGRDGQNSLRRWLYTTLRMFLISLIKVGFFLGLSLILFVISFFALGMFLVPCLLSLMVSYDCIDFTFEESSMSLRQRLDYFKNHFSLFFGLALVILVISIIPGLFTFMLPFFIAGGAVSFADIKLAERPQKIAEIQ